jgi:hypothetical protein
LGEFKYAPANGGYNLDYFPAYPDFHHPPPPFVLTYLTFVKSSPDIREFGYGRHPAPQSRVHRSMLFLSKTYGQAQVTQPDS